MSNEPSQEDREWGRRLKQAREALVGDNAANFARQIGMNAQTYRNYERGDRLPRRDVLEIFVDAGISLNWLYLGRHPMIEPRVLSEAT